MSYPYALYIHCGIKHAYFDGRLWTVSGSVAAAPRATAGASYEHGLMRLTGVNFAEFRSTRLTARFKPGPPNFFPQTCD